MRIPVNVPELRTGSEPLSIGAWLADEGEQIVAGDLIVEVLIPGITVDVFAESSGRLVQIVKAVGCHVATGETIAWIDDQLDISSNETPGPEIL